MLASIVIPTHNRTAKTERAISHVLKQGQSENVEIIIVDDCSDVIFKSSLLRPQDSVIRMDENVGAAVCRNIGIDSAKGELIYLLDSDDYFVKRNFLTDLKVAKQTKAVLYCDHLVGRRIRSYSTQLTKETFFKQIFLTEEGIGQTSSLCFLNELKLRFDETLPKHQDWDLLHQCLFRHDLDILKVSGVVYLDKGDRYSISRQLTPNKSFVWLQKLKADLSIDKYEWVRFNVLAKFVSEYKWKYFISTGVKYIFEGNFTIKIFLKRTLQRIILK